MKIVILINLFCSICFLIASLQYYQEQKKEKFIKDIEVKINKFELDIFFMVLISTICIFIISKVFNYPSLSIFNTLKQTLIPSTGIQSIFYIVNKKNIAKFNTIRFCLSILLNIYIFILVSH